MFEPNNGRFSFSLASGPLVSWCNNLTRSMLQHQGHQTARWLDPDKVMKHLEKKDILAIKIPAFEAYCTRFEKSPFKWGNATLKSVLVPLFKILQEKSKDTSQLNLVVNYAISAVNGWIDLYRSCEPYTCNWMVPGLVTLLSFLGNAGLEADQQQLVTDMMDESSATGEDDRSGVGTTTGDALQQTANQQNVLNTIRQHIGKFRGDEHRQAGYVVLLSESIQACMMLGNIQMAAAFLKTVESSTLNISRIPRGPLVSFNYYLGKLYMQQEKFHKAEEALAWAFANCRQRKGDFKRRIVECLTAVRLRMGKLPPEALLKRYELDQYLEIVKAMRSGNICRFETILADKTPQFVEEGTLLCVEKLKFIVYRTLFRKTLDWARDHLFNGESRNIVPLSLFTAAFHWQLSDNLIEFDDEEMACITANLIKLGYIKGYIAWEHRKIVLSKQSPVPPLQSIQLT